MAGDALIIVDVQNDFCPGGSLPVPRGDEVVPRLNKYIEAALAAGIPIFASRDWHPANTRHFAQHGGVWPTHCERGTSGAAFHPALEHVDRMRIVTKGTGTQDDGYSAFEGYLTDLSGADVDEDGALIPSAKRKKKVSLGEVLQSTGVTRVFVGGLATDYCVKQTVLDALNPLRADSKLQTDEQRAYKPGLAVIWLRDASLPVEVKPGDGEQAERDMLAAGARAITFAQFEQLLKSPESASAGR